MFLIAFPATNRRINSNAPTIFFEFRLSGALACCFWEAMASNEEAVEEGNGDSFQAVKQRLRDRSKVRIQEEEEEGGFRFWIFFVGAVFGGIVGGLIELCMFGFAESGSDEGDVVETGCSDEGDLVQTGG